MARRCGTRAATVVLTLAVACGGAASSSDGSAPASASPEASTVPILQHVRTGAGPIGITAAFGSIWVVNSEFRVHDRGSVTRVDPADGSIIATIPVGGVPLEVASAAGSIWVSNSDDASVSRIDPGTNAVVATIRVCHAPEGLAGTPGSVWVVCEDDDTVGRIDPAIERMTGGVDVTGRSGCSTNDASTPSSRESRRLRAVLSAAADV